MFTICSKIIKIKHFAIFHAYKSEQDFVSKYDIKTQYDNAVRVCAAKTIKKI